MVIEGGAIDNAAEGRKVKEAVGEYLAFDEVFGYCVNWAMQRKDTIVVACPDHDSGGFYDPDNQAGAAYPANFAGQDYADLESVLAGLYNGTLACNTVLPGKAQGHSPQNVPVWLYAPDSVRETILELLHLPRNASKNYVRSGRFYNGTVTDPNYTINNSDISPAIVKAAGLMSFDTATNALFVNVSDYGTYDSKSQRFTFNNGEWVRRNASFYVDAGGMIHEFKYGLALYVSNPVGYTTFDGTNVTYEADSIPNKAFYLPRSVLCEMGYIN